MVLCAEAPRVWVYNRSPSHSRGVTHGYFLQKPPENKHPWQSSRKTAERQGQSTETVQVRPENSNLLSWPPLHPSLFYPLLVLSLYLQILGSILRKHGVLFHCDEASQIYVPFKKNDACSVMQLFKCLDDIKAVTAPKFLHWWEKKLKWWFLVAPLEPFL